jgi:hypothetical protein
MVRIALACGLAGFLLSAGLAMGQDQAPSLDPPALVPPAPVPTPAPNQAPASATGTKPEQNRSLLVIPGVTAPSPTRLGPRPARPKIPAVILDPPTSPSPNSEGTPAPRSQVPQPGRGTASPGQLPLVLEAIPDEAPVEADSGDPPPARPANPKATRSNSAQTSTDHLAPSSPPASSASRPSQSRPSTTVLGRFLGPKATTESASGDGSSITVEPRSDPAAEAAVKRRIEKQVEQTLGDRVRSVDVRVTGRSVVFRAQASRFWQRRAVRRSLETLPLPSGYRGRVEMVD